MAGAENFRRFTARLSRERAEILALLDALQSTEPEPGGIQLDHPAELAGAAAGPSSGHG